MLGSRIQRTRNSWTFILDHSPLLPSILTFSSTKTSKDENDKYCSSNNGCSACIGPCPAVVFSRPVLETCLRCFQILNWHCERCTRAVYRGILSVHAYDVNAHCLIRFVSPNIGARNLWSFWWIWHIRHFIMKNSVQNLNDPWYSDPSLR